MLPSTSGISRGLNPKYCVFCQERMCLETEYIELWCYMTKSLGHTYWLASHITVLPHPAYQPRSLQGSLQHQVLRDLILGEASRLDAFSGYPFRT